VKNPAGINAFGLHLRELRKQKKLSQQELADHADIAKTTLQRIEWGDMAPTLDILISICRALAIQMSEMMDCPAMLDAD
jgi:DNA-binding XRE family transcriptional regulator